MCNPNTSAASRRRTLLSPLEQQQNAANSKQQSSPPSMSNQRFDPSMWVRAATAAPALSQHQQLFQQGLPSSTSLDLFAATSCNWNTAGIAHSLMSNTGSSSSSAFLPPTPFAPASAAVQVAPQEGQKRVRPKRRRKPQKPGKTAKQHDRHFVVHNYHDHAHDEEGDYEEEDVTNTNKDNTTTANKNNNSQEGSTQEQQHKRRNGSSNSFPMKLHAILDQVEADGLGHVISWQPHGRCFVIHKPKDFADHVMPLYFRQSKLPSFQRQLNLYGFQRITRGRDAGGHYHELFLRGKQFLCKRMIRTKIKGTKFKAASSPDQEPDFYAMEPVMVVTPPTSEYDGSSVEEGGGDQDNYINSSSSFQGRGSVSDFNFLIQQAASRLPANSGDVETPLPVNGGGGGGASSSVLPFDSVEFASFFQNAAPTPLQSSQFIPSTRSAFGSNIGLSTMLNNNNSSLMPSSNPTTKASGAAAGEAILDKAVQDLFSDDEQNVDQSLDFVNMLWDTTVEGQEQPVLENDIQLGNMLDMMLQEW